MSATPSRSSRRVPRPHVVLGLLLATALAACGAERDQATPTSTSTGDYHVTIGNCGARITFEQAPERVVLLKSAAVPFLHELGVMDRVTARAGQYPAGYYDDETLDELRDVPQLTDELDSSGHLQISQEVVLGEEPDLVLGEVDNLSRASLEAVGVPLIEEPALCGTQDDEPGFDDVVEQLEVYGTVFGREVEARAAISGLRADLGEIESRVGRSSAGSAAVLYPTIGGGTTYAYGTGSMAHPQLQAAGFDNVFADVAERVVEVTLEELLARDPDVLVLLHSEGDPAEVEAALTQLPGADELTAVRNGDVMVQLLNFTEPPTPLSVEGLERIVERFGSDG